MLIVEYFLFVFLVYFDNITKTLAVSLYFTPIHALLMGTYHPEQF